MADADKMGLEVGSPNVDDAFARECGDVGVDAKGIAYGGVLVAKSEVDVVGQDDWSLSEGMGSDGSDY